MLIFGKNNKKLEKLSKETKKRVYSFSLLSGHTCTFAKDCHAQVEIVNGKRKLFDGPHSVFRCFSASQEALYTAVYNSRKKNTEMIKNCGNSVANMRDLIESSLPKNAEIIRVHVAGDYMTLNYLLAWLEVAKFNPDIHFYSYTKAVPLYLKAADRVGIPSNFMFTMSRGGTHDHLIEENKLKEAIVVNSKEEADKLGLKIDETDYLAAYGTDSFALQLHSQGPKGSEQARLFSAKQKATKKIKKVSQLYKSVKIKDMTVSMNFDPEVLEKFQNYYKQNYENAFFKSLYQQPLLPDIDIVWPTLYNANYVRKTGTPIKGFMKNGTI